MKIGDKVKIKNKPKKYIGIVGKVINKSVGTCTIELEDGTTIINCKFKNLEFISR
jgi:RNase P/RNase MRP subunit p29